MIRFGSGLRTSLQTVHGKKKDTVEIRVGRTGSGRGGGRLEAAGRTSPPDVSDEVASVQGRRVAGGIGTRPEALSDDLSLVVDDLPSSEGDPSFASDDQAGTGGRRLSSAAGSSAFGELYRGHRLGLRPRPSWSGKGGGASGPDAAPRRAPWRRRQRRSVARRGRRGTAKPLQLAGGQRRAPPPPRRTDAPTAAGNHCHKPGLEDFAT